MTDSDLLSEYESHLLWLAHEDQAKHKRVDELIDRSFPQQATFVLDKSQFIAAECTRRAGKSNGLGFKYYRAAQKYPGSLLPYFALTRDSAHNIMWPVLQEINDRYGLGASLTESNLTATLPNKSRIKLFGADMKNFIQRVRGIKTPFAAVDEAQAFRAHLEELVDDILTPAISDYGDDGQIALTGTPGTVPAGPYFDACQSKGGFAVHRWSLYDNPYMPNPREFVARLKEKKGWADDHPTYLREYQGKWVQDLEALVYKFQWARNVTREVPLGGAWFYVLGVDLGYSPDPTAFVLCKYSLTHPKLYVVETSKEYELDVSSVAERVKRYLARHPECQVVMDLGGQGKQIGAEITKRHGIPVKAAEKTDKMGFIELMNSDFVQKNIQILESQAQMLADEYQALLLDAESLKRQEDKRFANHLADACLYAWRYCYQYAWRPVHKKPHPSSPEAVDEALERELERFQAEKDGMGDFIDMIQGE